MPFDGPTLYGTMIITIRIENWSKDLRLIEKNMLLKHLLDENKRIFVRVDQRLYPLE